MKANQSTILIVAGAAAALAYYFLFAKKATSSRAGSGAGGGGGSPTVVPVGTGGTVSGASFAQTAANAATETASNLLNSLIRSFTGGGGSGGGGSGAAAQIPVSRPGSSPTLNPAQLSSSQDKAPPKADQIGGGGAGSATSPGNATLGSFSDVSGTYTNEPNATSTNLPIYDQSGVLTNEPGPTSIEVPANEVPGPTNYVPVSPIEGDSAGYSTGSSSFDLPQAGLDLTTSDTSGGGGYDTSGGDYTEGP